MGVKNLWDILESCKKILPLHHLQNKRVCIDLSCWIVQLQNVNKSHCAMKDKLYLKGLFHRLRALIALNCSIIFVTDGSIPSIKLSAYRRRLNAGNEGPLQEMDSNKLSSVRRNMGSLFSCTIKEAKLLANALGIPCLDGVEEAEAQCAVLNSESLCDACFTSDSDAFLFGARTVYRDICLADGGYVVCYEMTDIEKNLGFGRNSLIALAVLLGGDYSNGVHGIGPESACNLVKSVGDSVVLQQLVSEGMSFVKKPKASKRKGENMALSHNNGIVSNIQSDAQFLQVIDAYLKPKFHSPDSDAVNRVLGTYSFNRIQLQEECTKFFDWSPEKTDEYILPKIAERNLRRYAYLRHTSSKVGMKLPIYEIPVKCPISSIIKPRTLKGRDYFEVSWNGFHGLKTSAVPADLIQSACPEKIAEFDERRAQVKKTKQCRARPKKIVNKTPMAEAEQTTFVIACEGSRVEKADDDAENPCSQELFLHDVATLDDSTNQEQQFQNRGQSKYSECNLMRSRLVKKTSVLTLLDDSTDQEQLFLDSGQCKFLDCNLMGSSRLVKKADVVTLVDSTDQKQLFQDSGQSKFMDCDLMGSRLVKKTEAVTLVDNDSKDKEQVLVDKSHRRHGETNHVLDCHFTAEVIDLVSPSPARRVSKSQEDNFQYMEIIDSENECSPEHLRRRRELDSFLDKVNKDDKQHSHNNSCINNLSL